MQANDLIADLRAEIAAWWEGKMADHRSSVIAAAAAALVSSVLDSSPRFLMGLGSN